MELRSRRGRLTLATLVLGSGIALLDGTVVNIAARTIGDDLDAGLASVQWVLNGYLLTLASLMLVGSSLGDRLGRRRVYLIGIAAFGATSLLCAAAQNPGQLIAARVLQGAAGALLTPGALALIQSSFRAADRPAAIGTWAGYAGVASALGPFLGGFLVENAGWRWIFALNVPLCLVVLWFGRSVPESRDEEETAPFDVPGGVAATAALGAMTYLLTSWRQLGTPALVLLTALSVVSVTAFVLLERRPGAMAPSSLFTSRTFVTANAMTFLVYGALGTVFFLLVLQLQVTAGYTPLEAGTATLPITGCMLLLSSRSALAAARTGPRLQLTVGPALCAAGVLLLAFVGRHASYVVHVLPGILLFAVGLTLLVSPLTTAVLAAAPERRAGVASGINNAVARAGSLLALAALPALVGLDGTDYRDPARLTDGFRSGLLLCCLLLSLGGVVSWVGLRPDEGGADDDGADEVEVEDEDDTLVWVTDSEFDESEPADPGTVDL